MNALMVKFVPRNSQYGVQMSLDDNMKRLLIIIGAILVLAVVFNFASAKDVVSGVAQMLNVSANFMQSMASGL
jgi:hypothetical protein